MVPEFRPLKVGRTNKMNKKCFKYNMNISNIIKRPKIMLQIKSYNNVFSSLLKNVPMGALRNVVKKKKVRVFYCSADCSKIS